MKLEIQHLAPYLPYGLKAKTERLGIFTIDGFRTIKNDDISLKSNDTHIGFINEITPILRQLSDLTKEIEVDGKRFILAELLWSIEAIEEDDFKKYGEIPSYWKLSIKEIKESLYTVDYGDFKKLVEYHFDVFGLIEQNLAVDFNTLNP